MRNKNARGFTIIEFMIVVSIGSILLTIAIPNFLGFRARAQQSEAKSNLATLFRAQKTVLANEDTYVDNLNTIGWLPEGELRYIIGFTSDSVPAASGINDTAELATVTPITTSKMVLVAGIPLTEADLPTSPVTKEAFTIGAAGNIDGDAELDQWTLNDANALVAVQSDVD